MQCLAVMVVFPAVRIVTRLPEIVATVVSELTNETGSVELAVAERANGASPKVFPASSVPANVMVWLAFKTVST